MQYLILTLTINSLVWIAQKPCGFRLLIVGLFGFGDLIYLLANLSNI